ncbi:MAG: B12-binding domain-containing radical SAM protein [Candidatus Omnitrophica bacterium]|nr:B12-binding domain-containing radical SAM protein [Candidatus Omnitrophota bacterium]
MFDICLVYVQPCAQGRLGTHVFDVVLPPLGLAYLAAVLERQGYTVTIIDAFAEKLSQQELLERLRDKYRIVGFYCDTLNYNTILDIANRLKRTHARPHIIIGGPHATALPGESISEHPQIDCAVFGEGEITIVPLVKRLLEEKSLKDIQGVAYKENGRIVVNQPRPLIEDLDSIPMPAWHLLPIKKYRSLIEAKGKRIMHIMGSRGCFNDCNYCFNAKMWHKKIRLHSAERIMQEVDYLRSQYAIQFIQFYDDNFTLDKKRLIILTEQFVQSKVAWSCSTRIDLLNEEIIQHLKRGHVDHVCIGIETVNDRLLKIINKNITSDEIKKTIELCNKYKVKVLGMFIIGIPQETEKEALETISFACNSNIFFAVFSCLTIFPGTNFFQIYKNSSYLSKDYSQYDLSKNFSFIEKNRSKAELERILKKAYLKFYTRPAAVYSLAMLMLRNPPQLLKAIIALLQVFFTLTYDLICSKEISSKKNCKK